MREETQPGQVWCWGSFEQSKHLERLWLILDVFPTHGDSLFLRDGLALDLEGGEQRPVFNLPALSRDRGKGSSFVNPAIVTWRRVL